MEDHLKLYLADVLQAHREGLSQEGLHVDFIPLDPNTHSLIKPPHHVDPAKKKEKVALTGLSVCAPLAVVFFRVELNWTLNWALVLTFH